MEQRALLIDAGLHPDSPYYPSRCWERSYQKTLMRATTSTARSWKGAHEASRSRMESLSTRTEAFETVARQLRESRKVWRKEGPRARAFLKSRPLLTQHEAIRKFYLSEGSDKGEILLMQGLKQQQRLLERNIAFGIKSFIAASRSFLALRLNADRLCLSAKDALYVNEACGTLYEIPQSWPLSSLVLDRCSAVSRGPVYSTLRLRYRRPPARTRASGHRPDLKGRPGHFTRCMFACMDVCMY